MFAGLMSRCTMPLVCAASSASATSIARVSSRSSSIGLPSMMCFRVWPVRHSITMKSCPSCWPISWMVQMLGWFSDGSGAGLAAEALESLGILGRIVGKKLQRDEAAEQRVFGFVNDAHAAAAEEFEDAVVGDSLADHGRSGPATTRPLKREPS